MQFRMIPKTKLYLIAFLLSNNSICYISCVHYHPTVLVVPPKDFDGKNLNIYQKFYDKVSESLKRATGERLDFGEMVLLLRDPLVGTDINSSGISWEAHQHPDVHFTDDQLQTVQSSFCGDRGQFMKVPRSILTDDQGPQKFVQHWAKHRFGIFDESSTGQTECFLQNRKWHLTGCYSEDPAHIVSVQLGSNGLPTCEYPRDLQKMFSGVKLHSSLAFTTELQEVFRFCDGSEDFPHNPEAPTLHNVLCLGKSTWDVIKDSEDFADDHPTTESKPVLRYVHETPPRLVFAIQKNIKTFTMYEQIRKALLLSVGYLLPGDFEVGVVGFSDSCSASLISNMTKLESEGARNDILKEFKWEKVVVDSFCPETVIYQATELLKGDLRPDTIILIGEAEKMVERVIQMEAKFIEQGHNCRISAIVFVERDNIALEALHEFTTRHSGSLYAIATKGRLSQIDTPPRLEQALVTSINTKTKEYSTLIYQASIESSSSGEFYTKSGSEGELIFHASCELMEGDRKLIFNGQEVDADPRTSDFTISSTLHHSSTIRAWTYSFDFRTEKQVKCNVMAFLSRADQLATFRSFTRNHLIYGHNVTGLYVEIVEQMKIERVEVIAIGYGNNEEISLTLKDDGSRDPDFQAGDGIYSTYFVKPSLKSSSFYTLYAKVKFSSETGVNQESVHRQLDSVSLPKETILSELPPSRITTLRVSSVELTKFTLQWRSTGSFLNSEKVHQYKARYAPAYNTLLNNFEDAFPLQSHGLFEVEAPGELQSISYALPDTHSSSFYVGIQAMNVEGRVGGVSNIVQVITAIEPNDQSTLPPDKEKPSSSSGPNTGTTESGAGEVTKQFSKLTSYTSTESGNSESTTSTEQEEEFWTKQMIIIVSASAFGGFALLLIIINIVVCCCIFKRRRDNNAKSQDRIFESKVIQKDGAYMDNHWNYSRNTEEVVDSSRETPSDISGAPYHLVNPNLVATDLVYSDVTVHPARRRDSPVSSDYGFESPVSPAPEPPKPQQLTPTQLMHQPVLRYIPTEQDIGPSPSKASTFNPAFTPIYRGQASTENRKDVNQVSYQGPRLKDVVNQVSYQDPRLKDVNQVSYQDPRFVYGERPEDRRSAEAFNPAFIKRTNNRLVTPVGELNRGAVNESFDYGVV